MRISYNRSQKEISQPRRSAAIIANQIERRYLGDWGILHCFEWRWINQFGTGSSPFYLHLCLANTHVCMYARIYFILFVVCSQVIMHSNSRSPCTLAHMVNNADVLVTPHGFQSMLLLFLPRPALVFEIFPYRYYKRGYGPFGNEYGTVLLLGCCCVETCFFLLSCCCIANVCTSEQSA
jgi:hypothetical protein